MTTLHPFEKAGLGRAPFRCIGFFESKYQAIPGDPSCPIQPGSMCDYCSAGIMNVFRIKSADGKEFKVGCDCVAKTYDACAKTELEREARRLRDEVNQHKREHVNRRKDERIAAAKAKLEANRGALSERTITTRSRVRPALEYLDWMFKNSGRTGKSKAARQLDELLASMGSAS